MDSSVMDAERVTSNHRFAMPFFAHRRQSVRRSVLPALLAGLGLTLAACGDTSTTAPPPSTLGHADGSGELALGSGQSADVVDGTNDDDLGDESGVAANEIPEEPLPIGPPLPALSSADQVLDVVSDMHGPTDDVSAQMIRLGEFPEVPTPEGATITEIRADVRETSDGERLMITSEVVVRADGPIADVVALYRDAFAEQGWELVRESESSDRRIRLGYEIPASELSQAAIEVNVSTNPDASDDRASASVHLRYSRIAGVEDDSLRPRFEAWVGDLPLPDGGAVLGAAVQTTDIGRHSLHYQLAVHYPDRSPAAISAELRSELPAGAFTESERPSMGTTLDTWVYLDHPFFEDARVSPHNLAPAGTAPDTVVNIDARVEFSPRG